MKRWRLPFNTVNDEAVRLLDQNVPEAWSKGTRVRKTVFAKGDAHPIGSLGTVVGSAKSKNTLCYFVIWDDLPGVPVFVIGDRIGLA